MYVLKKLDNLNLMLFVCLIFVSVFSSTPVYAADKYSSNTKSPTGVMKPRDMYFPGTEKLASDEMRIVSCGTGMPAARRGQAATCWLVELGNGDKFLFDIGSGSSSNIASLNIPYDYLNKVFVSHLHADHVGDMDTLWIGGWTGGRHGALNVWGPSGTEPKFGTKHFIEKLKDAFSWDYAGRLGIIPTGGGDIKVTEFYYRQINKVVYEKKGVVIRSIPAIHAIDGSVSYILKWKGLKFVFGGDTIPNNWYAKYAKGADIAIHESFMPPDLMMEKYGFSARAALNVATGVHTAPAAFGKMMSEVKPRMAIAFHFFNDFDTRYPILEGIRSTYDGPLTMADDLMVWNVTKDAILVRQVIVDDESWPAKSPTKPGEPDAKAKVEFTKFLKDGKMDMTKTLGPLMDKFKKENNLK